MKQNKIYYFSLTTLLCLTNTSLFSVGEPDEDKWEDVDIARHPIDEWADVTPRDYSRFDYTPTHKPADTGIFNSFKTYLNKENVQNAQTLLNQPPPQTHSDKINFQQTMSKLDTNEKNKLLPTDASKLNANHFKMLSHKQAMINQENGKQTIQDLKNPTLADAQNALNEYKKAPQVSDRDKELAAELFKNTIKIGKRLNETNQTTFIKKLLNDPMLKDPTSAEFQALFQASDIYSKNVLLKKFPLPENYTAEDMQKFIFIGNHLLKSDQYLNYDAQQRIFYVTPSKAVSIYQLFDNATAFGSRPAGQKMKVFFLQSFKDKFMNSPPNTQIDILNELINPKNPALQKTIEDPEILNFLIQIIQERAKFYENQYNDLEKTKPGIAISFADEWNGEGPNESLKKWMSKIKNARIYHIKFQTLLQDTPQVSTLTAQQESAKNQARRTAINQNLRILDLPETDPIPTAKQIETAYEKSTQRALENLPRPLREAQQANNAATFNALAKQTAYSDAASIYKQKMNTLDAAKQALQNLVSTQQA